MTFLNQTILFALAAISIPIIIHLFNRRKAKVIQWGAMQFLLGSLVNRKRRVLIEELILMALRCLLIAAVVLAIARPFSPVGGSYSWLILLPLVFLAALVISLATILARSRKWRWVSYGLAVAIAAGVIFVSQNEQMLHMAKWKSGTEQDVAIIIDGSDSMRIVVDGKTNFDRAIAEAKTLTQSLGYDDNISIIIAGEVSQNVTPEPVNIREDLNDLFDSLDPVGGKFDLLKGLSAATSSLAMGNYGSKKIVLISDGQKKGWQTDNVGQWEYAEQALASLPTQPKVVARYLDLPDQFTNVVLADFETSRSIVGTDREVTLRVRIENSGTEKFDPNGLQLEIENAEPMVEQVEPIEPGGSIQVNFKHRFTQTGIHSVRAKLLCSDDLDTDNQQTRLIQVLDQLPVLLVDGSNSNREFDRATTFVDAAMGAINDFDSNSDQNSQAQPLIQTTVISAPDFSEVTQLDRFHVVVLADVPRFDSATGKRLADFVESGGSLFLIAGKQCEADFYNSWSNENGISVVPGEFANREVISENELSARPDLGSAQGAAIRTVTESKTDLDRCVVTSYWKVDTGAAGDVVQTNLKFDNGDPIFTSKVLGKGQVFLSTISLDTNGNNLPALDSFVPLIHELTYELASPQMVELNHAPTKSLAIELFKQALAGPSNGSADSKNSSPASPKKGTQTKQNSDSNADSESVAIDVILPNGKRSKGLLASTHDLTDSSQAMTLSFTNAFLPGVYDANLEPDDDPDRKNEGELTQDDLTQDKMAQDGRFRFAVMTSPKESRLEPISQDEELVAQKHLDYFRASNTEQMISATVGNVPGHEIWKYLILGAMVILIAESCITRWIAHQRRLGSSETVSFVSEGEQMQTFQDRARELLNQSRSQRSS